jgi:hypothetical protein
LGWLRFEIGNPSSGQRFLSHGYNSVALLPDRHFLAADNYSLYELDTNGSVLRSLDRAGDVAFTDLTGVAYDAATNTIFATMAGHSGFFYQLMKIDYSSGDLLGTTSAGPHPGDIVITREGTLLVASGSQPAKLFTRELERVLTLGTSVSRFATQYVPEPPSHEFAVMVLAGVVVLAIGKRLSATAKT